MKSKGELLYEKIKEDIIKGRYKPSELINEGKIACEYGCSKTPARDALAVLTEQNYVVKHSRIGYMIKQLTVEESYKLTQLRYILDLGILKHIVAECTDEEIVSLYTYTQGGYNDIYEYNEQNKQFHLALARLTKNEFIVNQISNILNINMQWTSMYFFSREKGDAHSRHKGLIVLLLNRDWKKIVEWQNKEITWADEKPPKFLSYYKEEGDDTNAVG